MIELRLIFWMMLANEIDITDDHEKFAISTSGLVVEYIVAIDVTRV